MFKTYIHLCIVNAENTVVQKLFSTAEPGQVVRLRVSAMHIISRQVYELRFGSCQSGGDIFTANITALRFST